MARKSKTVAAETDNTGNGSADKATKFRELGAKRVNNAIKAISLIGNLSNRAAYSYTDADIKRMTHALKGAMDTTMARFATSAKDRGGFSF